MSNPAASGASAKDSQNRPWLDASSIAVQTATKGGKVTTSSKIPRAALGWR